jgi:hypothetical protein
VVSSLSLSVEQNINAEAPLKFKGRLEVEMSKIKHQSYTTINRVLGQAYYTKNNSYALKKCFKVRR